MVDCTRLVLPCPHCGGAAVRKRGFDTKPDPNGGTKGIKIQVWHCRDCGKTYREVLGQSQPPEK